METNDLSLSWLLASLSVIVAFISLYYAVEAKQTVEKRINEFIETTVANFEKEAGAISDRINTTNEKVTETVVRMNEQISKFRHKNENLRSDLDKTNKQLSDLRADLKKLDNRILPKYKK